MELLAPVENLHCFAPVLVDGNSRMNVSSVRIAVYKINVQLKYCSYCNSENLHQFSQVYISSIIIMLQQRTQEIKITICQTEIIL